MGKKKRPQGKPEAMSLTEFNQKTPVNMAIPRTNNINDPQWGKVDLNMSKDPQEQAKLFQKKMVSDQSAAAVQASDQSQVLPQQPKGQFGDFQSVSEGYDVKPSQQPRKQAAKESSDTLAAQLGLQQEEEKRDAAQKQKAAAPQQRVAGNDWNQVKEKKVEKVDKRDANIYKVAPSKPIANKQKNTTNLQSTTNKSKDATPVVQGTAIPGTSFVMPMPKDFVPTNRQHSQAVANSKPQQPAMPMPMPEKEKPKPIDTSKLSMDQVMQMMQKNGQKQVEKDQIQQSKTMPLGDHNNNDGYGDEYGDEGAYGDEADYGHENNFGGNQQQFNPMMMGGPDMQASGIDPNMLANMMQQLSMNPQAVQNLIDPNDAKSQMFFSGIQNMAAQFNQQQQPFVPTANMPFNNQMPVGAQPFTPNMMHQPQAASNNYNPDYFEYDDELPEGEMGERIILSNDPIPQEIGVVKTIGTKKMGLLGGDFNEEQEFYQWQEEEDDEDDERINAFLESQKPRPAKKVCMFYQTGSCRNGAKCPFAHEIEEPDEVGENQVHRYNPQDDAECQICLTEVLAQGRQFGVLGSCDHIFCLKCIRSWRATYDKRTTKHHFRTCPICRQTSYLVIPSYYHATGANKDALVDEYKGTLYQIPCRLFNKGRGECPFRDSCMYSHVTKKGEEFEYGYAQDKVIDSEGQWVADHEPTLAERMGMV